MGRPFIYYLMGGALWQSKLLYAQKKCWSSGEYPFRSSHELLTYDYMTWSEKQLYPSLPWSYTCRYTSNFPVQRGNIPNFASTLTECSTLHQGKSGECEQHYWGCMWPEVKGWWGLLDSLLHATLAPPSFPWLYLTLPHFDHGSSYMFLLPNWLHTTLPWLKWFLTVPTVLHGFLDS